MRRDFETLGGLSKDGEEEQGEQKRGHDVHGDGRLVAADADVLRCRDAGVFDDGVDAREGFAAGCEGFDRVVGLEV